MEKRVLICILLASDSSNSHVWQWEIKRKLFIASFKKIQVFYKFFVKAFSVTMCPSNIIGDEKKTVKGESIKLPWNVLFALDSIFFLT